jgi:hypothetical protein
MVSTSLDYDGILTTWEPTLQVYRCLRADFEAACAGLGFGFHAQVQGEDFRVVGAKVEVAPTVEASTSAPTPSRANLTFSTS